MEKSGEENPEWTAGAAAMAERVLVGPPTLTMEGYTTVPSLEALARLSDHDLSRVRGFTVSRAGYGQIQFAGVTDVRGLNLDELLRIEQNCVRSLECSDGDGSLLAQKNVLKKAARITLERVFPKHVSGFGSHGFFDAEPFIAKLRNSCAKSGACFQDYEASTGQYTFDVQSFE
jgi:nuclear pore complex protein Nup98-Nup96